MCNCVSKVLHNVLVSCNKRLLCSCCMEYMYAIPVLQHICTTQVLLNSNLPVDVLGRVWDLSDIDGDGLLDRDEFTVVCCFLLVFTVSVICQLIIIFCHRNLVFAARCSALAQHLLWRCRSLSVCLCVCYIDVLCPND